MTARTPRRYRLGNLPETYLAFRSTDENGRELLSLIPDTEEQHPLDVAASFLDNPDLVEVDVEGEPLEHVCEICGHPWREHSTVNGCCEHRYVTGACQCGRDLAFMRSAGGARGVSDPAFRTKIETMIGRTLARERRAGVDHFVPGQHHARRLEQTVEVNDRPLDVFELSYVDGGGRAWFVLVDRDDDRWVPVYAFVGGQTFVRELGGVPTLSDASKAALERAREAQ